MSLQRRPLTRCEVPLAIAADPTIVHDFDALNEDNGGPKIDEVTLFINNPTNGAINDVQVIVGDGVAPIGVIVVDVPASSTLQVFDQVAFRCSLAQNDRTIRIGANGNGLVVWGWFTRA